ncbi:hypothetical protein E0Z10_g3896 [Xylaria hypoxylon]|uniref:Uncharacterized protein n=1 Tax=Xylaria hypoxylon TaxID=37992 RepID=A0A4Z0YMA4_9PEZI|nr:hypothetical protein E0Z10_g3896 [Xylaria hypoxylon]
MSTKTTSNPIILIPDASSILQPWVLAPGSMPIPPFASDLRQKTILNREPKWSKASESYKMGVPLYSELPSSPYRPRAPVARMSPTLPEENPQPNVANKKSYVQDAEQDQECGSDNSHNNGNVSAVNYTPETGFSYASQVHADERADNAVNNNGNDGVIDLEPTSHNNGNHEGVAPSVDVKRSLRISDRSGRFHLGSQWQVPQASTARSNRRPRIRPAEEWIICNENEESDNSSDSELIHIYYENNMENDTAGPFQPNADTSSQEDVLSARLRAMHLVDPSQHRELSPDRRRGTTREGSQNYRDSREYQAPAAYFMYADEHYDMAFRSRERLTRKRNAALRVYPIPTDLSMSGAGRSGPWGL